MAGVKSLAVRGIRSFGPDETDEQRITFEKPLTLILGQNGCGKTTIIECLRYAITGQMPPGSRNECFVHDAKVNRTTEVMAQVKLKIMNAKDKQLEVTRSMRVTALHNKKTKFQTLDSFLSLVDDNGMTKDISQRCADLDSIMNEELGVSKAILNSVIFCHQEDSSWPLDEGKKVKERFDEIFDADKYSDCFDRLRKMRKEYTQSIKLLEQEVAHLTEKKQDLDKKKLEVVNTETRISESEIKVNELTQELKPISEKILAIEKLQKELVAFETKKEKLKTKLEHNQGQEEELKKLIKNIFEGTLEELQENISSHATTAKAKKKELDESYKKINSFNKEEEKIAAEKTSNEMKFNKLIFMESQNQERVDKLNNLVLETAKLAGLELTKADIENPEQVATAIENIKAKIESLHKELKEEKEKCDAEEKAMQKLVDDAREEFSGHKQKITGKEAELQSVKKDLTKADKAIADANKSKEQLDNLEKKINTLEEEYQTAVKEVNPEESQNEIAEDEKMMEKHEQDLEALSTKVTTLQKLVSKIKEKEMIEDSLKQKEKQFAVLKNKHRSAISDLLGQMPESNFAVSINKLECEKRNEVESMKQKLKEKQMEVTSLEAERKHVRESLMERRSELTKAEDLMYKACGTQPYDTMLSKVTAQVEKLQEEQNLLQSSMFIFAKYKSQLKDNTCCPLCNRGFESETEVTQLIDQLTTQVMNVPAKLEKATEDLQKSSAKKDDLLSKKSLNEKIVHLKETDIPQIEKRLSEIDKQKTAASDAVEELSMALIEPEQKLQTAKQIQGDMPMLDRYTQEIKTTTAKLEAIKSQCPEQDTDMTLEEASARQTDLRQKISSLKAGIKKANTRLNAYNKKLQVLGEKKNKLKEQQLNVQKKVQEIVSVEENKKALETKIEEINTELVALNAELDPLQQKLKDKENEKSELVKKLRNTLSEKNKSITGVENSFDKVKSVDGEIKAHKERNIKEEMAKIKEANNKLTEKQKALMADRNALTKTIEDMKDEISKQEINKRDLDDNLKLRKAQTEIENFQKELAEVDEKLSGINTDSIAEKEQLITQQTRLFREKAQTEGSLNELKKSYATNKAELAKAQKKNIESKYREKFYELHVTKQVDKDIKDYSIALEKCLMEFHREKMEHINLIIREMWRKIYRGNDIDYIEIKTESSMTGDSDRRKYDYRVVQSKNGVEIDMRGRCSAGQKVLACLIIRLALAETFSSRFGILALDEPTTNLDQENIRSLCSALGEIVQERMTQKNFMFIIITHDKEFIESLGSIDKVTHYYEVSRNEDGKSRIKKIRFS